MSGESTYKETCGRKERMAPKDLGEVSVAGALSRQVRVAVCFLILSYAFILAIQNIQVCVSFFHLNA